MLHDRYFSGFDLNLIFNQSDAPELAFGILHDGGIDFFFELMYDSVFLGELSL